MIRCMLESRRVSGCDVSVMLRLYAGERLVSTTTLATVDETAAPGLLNRCRSHIRRLGVPERMRSAA